MKNFKLILVLAIAIVTFSCKSDDDGGLVAAPSPNADLLGTWSGTALTATVTGTIVDSSNNTTTPYEGSITGSNLNFSIAFTETPNVITSSGTFDTEFVITQGTSSTTVTETGATFLDASPGTWTRNGTSLTIVDGSDSEMYSLTITGNTMLLSRSEMSTEVDGTETDTSTIISRATFTKQ